MLQVPAWRVEPQQVWISCQQIRDVASPGELLVQFRTNGQTYTALVPERFVDREAKGLQGFIIADWNDDLLVDIPTETFTSGPRILVRNDEQHSVLTQATSKV